MAAGANASRMAKGKQAYEDVGDSSGAIDGSALTDASIATAKLEDDAVTTAKIDDSAVTTAKIDDAAVTAAKTATDNAAQISVEHDSGDTTLLAAAAVTRLVEVETECTETLAGDTTVPVASVGWDTSTEALLSEAQLAPATGAGDSGDVLRSKLIVLPPSKALTVFMTDGTGGNEAGAFTVSARATVMPAVS